MAVHDRQDQVVRAAATLTADAGATAVPGLPVNCLGAKAVVFSYTAGDATQFAAGGTIQVSDDGVLWQTAATTNGCNISGAVTGAMNAGGIKLILVPTAGTTTSTISGIPWKFCRPNMVPNATTDIPNLQVLANRFYGP